VFQTPQSHTPVSVVSSQASPKVLSGSSDFSSAASLRLLVQGRELRQVTPGFSPLSSASSSSGTAEDLVCRSHLRGGESPYGTSVFRQSSTPRVSHPTGST